MPFQKTQAIFFRGYPDSHSAGIAIRVGTWLRHCVGEHLLCGTCRIGSYLAFPESNDAPSRFFGQGSRAKVSLPVVLEFL